MNTVGFREDRDAKIISAEYIDSLVSSNKIKLDDLYKSKLLEYLSHGTRVFSITLWMYDNEDSIGPYVIYTDGVWLWPSHLVYYIERGDYRYLKSSFLEFLESKNYLVEGISIVTKQHAIQFLEGILNIRKRKS
jgi:hypothetical protein